MSSTLMWKPERPEGKPLSDGLKRALSSHLWDTDGSCGNGEARLTSVDIPVLKGMKIAGHGEMKNECQMLIEAIEKFGAVIVWHEH